MAITIRNIRDTLFSNTIDGNAELKNNLMTMILEMNERERFIFLVVGIAGGLVFGMLIGMALSSLANPSDCHGVYTVVTKTW